MKKINLKNLAKEKWNIEHYDGCPAFTEMTAHGFTKKLYNSTIPVYKKNLCYYKESEGDWMSLYSDHQLIGAAIVKIFLKNEKVITNLHRSWLENFDSMMAKFYDRYEADISGLDNEVLIGWAEEIYKYYRKISMPGFLDGFMFYADKRFDGLIKDFCEKNKINNYPEIFSVLSAPVNPSFINEEITDLKKLKSKKGKDLETALKFHILKYAWIKSSYAGYKKYTRHDAKKELAKIKTEKNKE